MDLTPSTSSHRLRNAYVLLARGEAFPIEPFQPPKLDRGLDYWIDIFAALENQTAVEGFVFYLSELMPRDLPGYGNNVVLIVTSDERYQYRDYFMNIHLLLRSYGRRPYWGYGFPVSRYHFQALLHHLYKSIQFAGSVASATLKSGRPDYYLRVRHRIVHSPLGTFFRFEAPETSTAPRPTVAAFMGSARLERRRALWKRPFESPKTASRLAMLQALKRVPFKVKVIATAEFEDSIKHQERYEAALRDCRISICPRGSNLETYRFYESIKSGCIIVGEPLPRTWFFPEHPGIELKTWSALRDVIVNLMEDEPRLVALSLASIRLWQERICESAVARYLAGILPNRPKDF